VGDLKDLYIESVVYKGEHNEIILESDERKWLMLSDTDEQVATYVPLSFNFLMRAYISAIAIGSSPVTGSSRIISL